jgi:hypothetical protein
VPRGVLASDDADHTRHGERGGGVDRTDAGMRERRAHDRRDAGVRQRIEVVDEPPLAPQEGIVLNAQRRSAGVAGGLLASTGPGRHVPG